MSDTTTVRPFSDRWWAQSLIPSKVALCCCLIMCLSTTPPARAIAVNAEQASISLALRSEPPSLNSLQSTDRISSFILAHVMEGLVRYGSDGELQGAAAERWQVQGNQLTFYLRESARWSDGKPLRAQDFVFAWRMLVTPANNARYAGLLAPVKNARAILAGQMPASALAVKAIDDKTLHIELATPAAHFIELTAFMTLYPLREDVYQRWGKAYAADAEKMLFNGAFTLQRWVHGARLTLQKNAQYWNKAAVKLNTIDIPYITSDNNAVMNLFNNGDIALADELKASAVAQALNDDLPLHSFDNGSLYFYAFNFRKGNIMRNRSLREAISLVLSPATITQRLLSVPGARSAYSLYPEFLHIKAPRMFAPRNLAAAQKKLQQARAQLGRAEIPVIRLLIDDAEETVRRAEHLQFVLRQSLGLNLVLDRQTFKQRISKSIAGQYDIVARSWSPDFNDGLTFAELFFSDNPNNRSRYHNDAYDQLLLKVRELPSGEQRRQGFIALQQILARDVALLPLFESNILYVQHPKLQGVQRRIFGGDPSFLSAWITP